MYSEIRFNLLGSARREHVYVDRVACPWLIKRFIDPNAEFRFIPWLGTELKPEDGIPFDIPGVELSHHDNKCSFEAIIEKYNLKDDPALLELAKIVKHHHNHMYFNGQTRTLDLCKRMRIQC